MFTKWTHLWHKVTVHPLKITGCPNVSISICKRIIFGNIVWEMSKTLWTATMTSPPFNHTVSVRSNQRSVFILTLDVCLDVSRGRTWRPRLEWEKEDRRMGHWYREVLVSAASRGICCFVSQAGLSMSEQIQFIRQADMQNQNSTLPLLALVTLKNKDGVIDKAKCNNRESTLMPRLHFTGKSDSALGTKEYQTSSI